MVDKNATLAGVVPSESFDEGSHAARVEVATKRLRGAYSEIAQLAGGLAHEIRNPLSTMRMNLELLAEEFENSETARDRRALQKIDRIHKESLRLQAILEDFLRFAGVLDASTKPTNLNELVEDLRDFCEGQASALGIISRTQLDPALPSVSLDSDMFKQALLNLILNAQHAMPEGGELMLTTRREGCWAVLDVVDTGIGIPEADQPRVFDAFFSTRPGGSGLGLPTTRKIVEAHGGFITLESEPGKGSKFSLRLPISDSSVPAALAP
jgi:signal transduction histidine kinase